MTDGAGQPLTIGHSVAQLQASVTFQGGRTSLPASDRVAWRLSALALVLAKFRANRASIAHLHLLMWAMRTPATRALMVSWWEGRRAVDLATVRVDPRLEVTLSLAAAENLIQMTNAKKVALLPRGLELGALIDADIDLMKPEKELLRLMAPLNESAILRHMGGAVVDY